MSILDSYEPNWLYFQTVEDHVKEGDVRLHDLDRLRDVYGNSGRMVYANEVIHRMWPRKNLVWWKEYFPKTQEKKQ